jgi:hypothetical protein
MDDEHGFEVVMLEVSLGSSLYSLVSCCYLNRLAHLVTHVPKPLYDDEAGTVIEDLTRLVNSILSSPTLENGGSRKMKLNKQDVDKDLSARELKRICGIILSSHIVDVNEKGTLPLKSV